MTALRKCDVKSCGELRSGVYGSVTSFKLEHRDVDLCPSCTKELNSWLNGEAEIKPTIERIAQ